MSLSATLRPATAADAVTLHTLARSCPPLDVHTHYTYWVLASQFGDLCTIAEVDGEPAGLVTTVLREDRAFLWQIGMIAEQRGTGLAARALDRTVAALRATGARSLSVSIAPDNRPSLRTFQKLAARLGTELATVGDVDLRDPDSGFVEYEHLFRIALPAG